MSPEEVPAELKSLLDMGAGRVHSANGSVMRALAKILTRHREMILSDMEPGRWFRVVTETGALWAETADEDEARAQLRPGWALFRQWRRVDTEWRPVDTG